MVYDKNVVLMGYNRDHKMDFGYYKGESIRNVPDHYLIWMLDNFSIDYWVELVEKELEYRNNNNIVIRGKKLYRDSTAFWDDMEYWDTPDIWGDL